MFIPLAETEITPATEAAGRPSGALRDLLPALRRLDEVLGQAIEAAEAAYGPEAEADPFRGLHISPEDVERDLTRSPGLSPLRGATAVSDLHRAQPGQEDGRLSRLQKIFGLSSFEMNVLLIGVAPEIDLRYERLYAYLQDDVTKRRPRVDLALNLLCATFEEKVAARKAFASAAPLRRHHLLHLFDDPSQPNPPLLGRYFKVDDRLVAYLLGSDEPDSPTVRRVAPGAGLDELSLPEDLKDRLTRLPEASLTDLTLYLQGSYGTGKQAIAEAICMGAGLALLVGDLRPLIAGAENDWEERVRLVVREALLQNAVLFLRGVDPLLEETEGPRLAILLKALEECPGPTFLAGEVAWEPSGALQGKRFVRLELPRLESRDRMQLWRRFLPEGPRKEIDEVAGKFRFSGGQIRDAAATARNLACWRDPASATVTLDDLHEACRRQSNRKLATLAQKITPRYRWEDIVLPASRLQQLRETFNAARYRALVYGEWGFGQKLSLGKGLNVLFSGPSGTGKTMAAEIMAGELGLDLYKIDLSTVVSKYIGETEKNLSRIFVEAETANAILFFDEADALFGKRSEVRDAHDRYANIEIGYLLQKMEEYDGVVILATNLSKNMDDAFVRRMHCTLEFPFPGARDRRRIWDGVWPAPMPRRSDLDLDFMAGRFEITGGNIKNIALAAAFLAAEDDGEVGMSHLVRATQREFQKMGRVVLTGEFGEYGALVAGS